ncbi:probable LRR receptor-like serine/threonine-protein kinase At1g53420 isoform X1 [Solanum stenotomum]|uniref:probable LRR receptor-like serine/threonine-protein kinase At1g53420 isoform X1 n=3 Tax=Solanum stenotomum TaxID=172797 RepID=UPI0020D19914|nr:probable LRR receptor-like serine/threonine-protein kinase At1g53420 isoform X1 [Solanum stenotomum]
MAMFMYVYRIFISLLLILVHCEVTVEQATHGPLRKICTFTRRDKTIAEIPPLAREDEDVITEMLRCNSTVLPPRCLITGSNSKVICNCTVENHKRCRVVEIDFSDRRIEGGIPQNIGNLKYLTTLNLDRNKLNGPIPESFKDLTRLTHISLCDNSLNGTIPLSLGEMKSLQKISLCKNFFNETIPPNLKSLKSLEYLDLSYNLLSGNISELGGIGTLTELNLADNQLSGKLPDSLTSFVNLEELQLQNNEFVGALPLSFHSLVNLKTFDVRGNNLNGTIPDIFGGWEKLLIMNLMGNTFSASFPPTFSELKNLQQLYISDSVGEQYSFPDLSTIESLTTLTLRNCSLKTGIPDWIWKIPQLEYLDLSFNNLSGVIPETGPKSLKFIFLRKNKLTGTIPAWVKDYPYVDLSENHFNSRQINKTNPNLNLFACCFNEAEEVAKQDQVDLHCKNGAQLDDHLYINCGGESVSVNGNVYEADVHENGGSTFFMSNNSNWGYSSMGTFLWAIRNRYTINDVCEVHTGDAELYGTARLSSISLKYYGFCLVPGTYKVILHFAEISSRKYRLSHGKTRRVFDVEIQGTKVLTSFNIEAEAERQAVNEPITREYSAEVHNNLLEIHLYWSGKGSILYPSDNYGPLISAITVTLDQSHLSQGVLVGISGSALLFLILFIVFSWMYQDKLRREELELIEFYPGGLYNYQKIKAATNNFHDGRRLGEGGFGTVYEGTLLDGTAIAVKKLSTTKEGMNEFVEKSRTIAGMKHPNLVTLMGCCAGKNQLLLVYEYIGTKSLEDALFGSEELRARLDWPTRYRICLGLAEGLTFLHEGSKLEIIHGNIRPANILLDDDLNPKIYDFGFAKLYHKQKSEGTMSYTAPEVKDHALEASADVYSFGVVMLILVSGMKIKTPRAGGDTEYLVDEAQIKNRRGTLMELVDQNLNYDWEEAEMILRLAIQCTDSPPFRPTMSTIVKILRKERSIETILIKPKGD